MHRRRFLASASIFGMSGCLRLQGSTTPTPDIDRSTATTTTEEGSKETVVEVETTPESTTTATRKIDLSVEDAWPQFQFDAANSGNHPSTTGPVDNVDLVWTFERRQSIPSHRDRENGDEWITFIPTVADGAVFVSSQDNAIYSIDANTGRMNWQFSPEVGTEDPSRKCTPAVSDGLVIAEGNGGQLFAIDQENGEEVWRRDIVFEYSHIQPTVSEGNVFIDGPIDLSLRVDDGSVNWVRDDLGWTNTIAVGEQAAYIAQGGPEKQILFALDKSSGETIWSLDGPANTSAVDDDAIYTTNNPDTDGFDGPAELYRVNPDDGSVAWRIEIPENLDGFHPPTLSDDAVIIGAKNGDVYSYNKQDGDLNWVYRTLHNTIRSAPVIADGHVYFGTSWEGSIQCITVEDGKRVWSHRVPNEVFSPTVVDNVVFFGDNRGKVYAFSEVA